jgi:hypothetical protein
MTTFGGLVPSSTSQINTTYRIQEYQYGNGYTAFAPDGANMTLINAQVNFDNLDSSRAATLDTWIAANPTTITWAGDGTLLPTNRTFRITKDGVQKTPLSGGVFGYQFNVMQVY